MSGYHISGQQVIGQLAGNGDVDALHSMTVRKDFYQQLKNIAYLEVILNNQLELSSAKELVYSSDLEILRQKIRLIVRNPQYLAELNEQAPAAYRILATEVRMPSSYLYANYAAEVPALKNTLSHQLSTNPDFFAGFYWRAYRDKPEFLLADKVLTDMGVDPEQAIFTVDQRALFLAHVDLTDSIDRRRFYDLIRKTDLSFNVKLDPNNQQPYAFQKLAARISEVIRNKYLLKEWLSYDQYTCELWLYSNRATLKSFTTDFDPHLDPLVEEYSLNSKIRGDAEVEDKSESKHKSSELLVQHKQAIMSQQAYPQFIMMTPKVQLKKTVAERSKSVSKLLRFGQWLSSCFQFHWLRSWRATGVTQEQIKTLIDTNSSEAGEDNYATLQDKLYKTEQLLGDLNAFGVEGDKGKADYQAKLIWHGVFLVLKMKQVQAQEPQANSKYIETSLLKLEQLGVEGSEPLIQNWLIELINQQGSDNYNNGLALRILSSRQLSAQLSTEQLMKLLEKTPARARCFLSCDYLQLRLAHLGMTKQLVPLWSQALNGIPKDQWYSTVEKYFGVETVQYLSENFSLSLKESGYVQPEGMVNTGLSDVNSTSVSLDDHIGVSEVKHKMAALPTVSSSAELQKLLDEKSRLYEVLEKEKRNVDSQLVRLKQHRQQTHGDQTKQQQKVAQLSVQLQAKTTYIAELERQIVSLKKSNMPEPQVAVPLSPTPMVSKAPPPPPPAPPPLPVSTDLVPAATLNKRKKFKVIKKDAMQGARSVGKEDSAQARKVFDAKAVLGAAKKLKKTSARKLGAPSRAENSGDLSPAQKMLLKIRERSTKVDSHPKSESNSRAQPKVAAVVGVARKSLVASSVRENDSSSGGAISHDSKRSTPSPIKRQRRRRGIAVVVKEKASPSDIARREHAERQRVMFFNAQVTGRRNDIEGISKIDRSDQVTPSS